MTAAPHTPGHRAGFTLIELLVAMAVIVTLATIAVVVIPQAIERDRTTDAASTVRQHLMIAKTRATRENDGRGLRFIVALDPNNPAKTNPLWATEIQYIESAPKVIPNPLGLTGPADPYVVFDHTNANGPTCTIVNVTAADEVCQIIDHDLLANWFPTLYCPVLGPDAFGRPQRFQIIGKTAAAPNAYTLALDRYPTTLMGAGTQQRVYRFAVEARSRPLLGEPSIPLPKNLCVDLEASIPPAQLVSLPGGTKAFIDYEIMFSPNGQLIYPEAAGAVHLWVRDYTRYPGNPAKNDGLNPATYNYAAFEQGGDQQLVSIKAKTGSLGVFPVLWPQPNGQYLLRAPGPPPTYFDPYYLAQTESLP
ncbi:type II secretion system protein [bacterium]|nr:type II secretion system protein [bacterium]